MVNENVYRQQALQKGDNVSLKKAGVISVPDMWKGSNGGVTLLSSLCIIWQLVQMVPSEWWQYCGQSQTADMFIIISSNMPFLYLLLLSAFLVSLFLWLLLRFMKVLSWPVSHPHQTDECVTCFRYSERFCVRTRPQFEACEYVSDSHLQTVVYALWNKLH